MRIACNKIWADQVNNKSREMFSPEDCHSLAASIQSEGLLQPVTVVPIEHPEYEYKLVFGYRRFVATHIVLAQSEIEANVSHMTDRQADIANAIENIERKDLSFYEECLCLKNLFPPDAQQIDIGKEMKRSRAWVRPRWQLWKLPEDVIQQVRAGFMGAADVGLLVQQAPEEVGKAAERIRRGKEAGEATANVERELSNRRGVRPKKDVQRVMTILMENERTAEMHTLRYAIGEISDTLLFEMLGL